MKNSFRPIVFSLSVFILVGSNNSVFGQYGIWQDVIGKEMFVFSIACTSEDTFNNGSLARAVRSTIESEGLDTGFSPNTAFAYPIVENKSEVFFVPYACGGTGNCSYAVFTSEPHQYVGTVVGMNVYIHISADQMPKILTYTHHTASEGYVNTFLFKNDKYSEVGEGFYIHWETPGVKDEDADANEIPVFLQGATKLCEDVYS